MKDQSPILEKETQVEKRERARCLFLESLHKPDHELRGCAHNQKCFNELMEIRDDIIEYVKGMRELKPGEKNDAQVKSFNGISVALLRGSLGKYYMKDWTEEQIKEYEDWVSINS
tara:strand:- start:33 stop:377 length:345 start_codon:yes stop_codon:yes gene_type:complete